MKGNRVNMSQVYDIFNDAVKEVVDSNRNLIRNWYKDDFATDYAISGIDDLRDMDTDDLIEAEEDWVHTYIPKFTEDVCNLLGISSDTIQYGSDYHIELIEKINSMLNDRMFQVIDQITSSLVADIPYYEDIKADVLSVVNSFNEFTNIDDLKAFIEENELRVKNVSISNNGGVFTYPSLNGRLLKSDIALEDIVFIRIDEAPYENIGCISVGMCKGKVDINNVNFDLHSKRNGVVVFEDVSLKDVDDLLADGIIQHADIELDNILMDLDERE